jgi:hypothetical protein
MSVITHLPNLLQIARGENDSVSCADPKNDTNDNQRHTSLGATRVCLLFPQKRTFADATVMSAKCQTRTFLFWKEQPSQILAGKGAPERQGQRNWFRRD